jgi:hypothetical protein
MDAPIEPLSVAGFASTRRKQHADMSESAPDLYRALGTASSTA